MDGKRMDPTDLLWILPTGAVVGKKRTWGLIELWCLGKGVRLRAFQRHFKDAERVNGFIRLGGYSHKDDAVRAFYLAQEESRSLAVKRLRLV